MGGKRLTDAEAIGKRFGRLVITGRGEPTSRNHTTWVCQCDCGAQTRSEMDNLVRGLKKSCGCLKTISTVLRCTKHGATLKSAEPSITRAFRIWAGMRKRCHNPHAHAYKDYGGRGIYVSDKWHQFSSFINDMGPPPEGYSIERIDVNKGYEPENCIWIPRKHQAQNKRTSIRVEYNGFVGCLKELCKARGISYMKVYKRYRIKGQPLEEALQP